MPNINGFEVSEMILGLDVNIRVGFMASRLDIYPEQGSVHMVVFYQTEC